MRITHWPWLFYLENCSAKSCFRHYTLYLHQELICYHCENKLGFHKGRLNNFDFILINNGSVNNCNFIEKGISSIWKIGTVTEAMNITTSILTNSYSAKEISKPPILSIMYLFLLNKNSVFLHTVYRVNLKLIN